MFINETEKPLHQLTKATPRGPRAPQSGRSAHLLTRVLRAGVRRSWPALLMIARRLSTVQRTDRVVAIAPDDIVQERTPQSLLFGSSVNSRLHRCSKATPDFLAVFTTPDPATPVGREIGTRR